MEELVTAAATIQGAQIQANYALWSSVIGAFAVILTIYFAAKNTVKQIKLEKVAESKRDQYIALTDAYTSFLVSTLVAKRPDKDLLEKDKQLVWDDHLKKYIELYGCINKVCLVTTSEIRLELIKFQNEIIKYQTSFSNFYFINGSLDSSNELEIKAHQFAKLLREDLGIESDDAIENEILILKK